MKNTFQIVFILCISLLFIGCSITSNSAKLVPNTLVKERQSFYVIHLDTDKRHIDQMIAKVLTEEGYTAISGSKDNIPDNIDVLVTYEDRWMWDITNYLIQLDIQFRNSDNFYPYVAGETIRTSLSRKSPEEMARETLFTMLNKTSQGK